MPGPFFKRWYEIEITGSYFKKRILVQDVGGAGFQTAGILQYVEDLKAGPNTRIGPKDLFEIASNKKLIRGSLKVKRKPDHDQSLLASSGFICA